ncbi:MAG: hypothetical protein ACYTKD_12915 [Planctomycetota bacterium]|jgi:hypothetical protein
MTRTALACSMALALTCGCYERTWFYPAPGQGSLVTSGSRLGVAHRLSGDDPQAQSFIVLSVEQAYTAEADGGLRRTVVQVTANVVNRAAAPARFEVGETRLEVAGRSFAPRWRYVSGGAVPADPNKVPPNTSVRHDMYFDLGGYPPGRYAAGAPPLEGGIPLATLKEFSVSWKAEWGGEKRDGSFRFVRDYSGRVGTGWSVAPGPYWGYGWWYWPYPWPTGVVIHRPYYPWHYYHYAPRYPYYKVRPGITVAPHPHVKTRPRPRVKASRGKTRK